VYPAVDGAGTQVVLPTEEVLAGLDLSPETADPADFGRHIDELANRGFDVTARPPVRTALLATADRGRHVLVVILHHICCDGWSLGPLATDLGGAYEARAKGKSPDWQPLRVDYADYTLWHRELLGEDNDPGSLAAAQLAHWRAHLAGDPPPLELPGRARPARRSARGDRLDSAVPAEVAAGVERLARQANVTSFMVLHAALAVLLARLSGSSDIVVGAPVAGRSERALAPLVGMFVNTIPLRTEVRTEETFTEFLRRVGEIDVEGFAHSDLPYERIVDHLDPRRGGEPDPLCRVYLAFENMLRPRLELSGATVEILDPGPQAAKTDLVVTVAENAAAGSDIPLRIDYAADLFDQATVEEFAARLNRVLAALVAEPGTRVGAVEVLSEAERARLVPAAGRRAEPAR